MRGGASTATSSFSSLRSFSSPKANGTTTTPTIQLPLSPGLSSFSTISARPATPCNANDGDTGPSSEPSSDAMFVPPGLNEELAALSDKLIKAINHTTMLDDSLQNTKHELEISKARIKQLEAIAKQHDEMMAKGLLVEKKEVDIEHEQFMKRLREERSQRSKVEKEKKSMEQELEHLTTALFEEANKMVTASRREKDAMDRKNEQLRAQLHDTELLVASHQEQLAELKLVLQQMTAEREESEMNMSNMSTPTTPGLGNRSSKESLGRVYESMSLSSVNHCADEILPTNPLSLSQLLQPVLRYDTGSYQEFCSMLRAPKNLTSTPSPVAGRLSGGSLTSFQVMGMGISIGSIAAPHNSPTAASNSSSAPSTPIQPPANPPTSLKEAKFYKRVLVEDIEPTLRLDTAPGLSWLARRNVLIAITDGSLVIDPIPTSSKLHLMACCLCGESQNDEHHVRTHKMRTSETDTIQKYPLCTYCVGRLRATCDFLSFLRAVKDGLWKYETEDDERHAWDEAVKLRDKMFWSRIGGGVVPAGTQNLHKVESQRNSVEQLRQSQTSGQGHVSTPPPSSPPRTPRALDPPSRGHNALAAASEEKRSSSYLTPIKKLGFGKFGFLDTSKVLSSPSTATSRPSVETSATAAKDEEPQHHHPITCEPDLEKSTQVHAGVVEVEAIDPEEQERGDAEKHAEMHSPDIKEAEICVTGPSSPSAPVISSLEEVESVVPLVASSMESASPSDDVVKGGSKEKEESKMDEKRSPPPAAASYRQAGELSTIPGSIPGAFW